MSDKNIVNSSAKNYGDESIQVLEGLEAVRKRYGMYIGSVDKRGLHHLFAEIVDNAIDEGLNGFGDVIEITINKDESLSVRDYGRGVPCGMHPSGKNTLEVIYGTLHSGGKFNEDSYLRSAGTNGVGAAVCCGLSKWLDVTSFRDGKATSIHFSDGGSKVSEVKVRKSNEHGTLVTFLPDDTIFTETKFDFDLICSRMKEKSFLVPLKFVITDARNGNKAEYFSENGLSDFLDEISSGHVIFPKLIIEGGDEIQVKAGIKITTEYSERIESFANMVHTTDGGYHETGFRQAVTRAFNDYGKQSGILKKPLEGSDIREGFVGIVVVNVPERYLAFESQTKEKLGSVQAKKAVEDVVYDKLKYFLIENPKIAKNALDKMVKAMQTREQLRKAKEDMRSAKNKNKIEKLISEKLSPCRDKNGKNNELFLVEGDSAGGSAKQGRDSKFQAILPLRGKTLNPLKASLVDVLKNEELNTIINCIGAGFGEDFDEKKMKYDKIIIMADADVDGSHIKCLLITFFYKIMPEVITGGHLYSAMPPLYKLTKGKQVEYAYNDEDLARLQKKMGKCELQRYKGLGEMSYTQLWETTMDPESRIIQRLNIEDAKLAEEEIVTLMGDDVPKRKKWINENIQFTMEDNFQIAG